MGHFYVVQVLIAGVLAMSSAEPVDMQDAMNNMEITVNNNVSAITSTSKEISAQAEEIAAVTSNLTRIGR